MSKSGNVFDYGFRGFTFKYSVVASIKSLLNFRDY